MDIAIGTDGAPLTAPQPPARHGRPCAAIQTIAREISAHRRPSDHPSVARTCYVLRHTTHMSFAPMHPRGRVARDPRGP